MVRFSSTLPRESLGAMNEDAELLRCVMCSFEDKCAFDPDSCKPQDKTDGHGFSVLWRVSLMQQ